MYSQTSSDDHHDPTGPVERGQGTREEHGDTRAFRLQAGGQSHHPATPYSPDYQAEIRETKEAIKILAQQLDKLQERIDDAGKKFFNATNQRDQDYWREEKKYLVEEKKNLVEKEKNLVENLVEEKKNLAEEKKNLAEKEKYLQEEKVIKLKMQLYLRAEKSSNLEEYSDATIWKEAEVKLDGTGFDEDGKLFCLDGSYLKGVTDNEVPRRELLLYCREAFSKHWQFLREEVISNGALGWIQGPPGSGKTMTTLSFCFSQEMSEWSVTILRVGKDKMFRCIQTTGSKRRWCTSNNEMAAKLTGKTLSGWSEGQKRLVILDGFVRNIHAHERVYEECRCWRDADRKHRRLVVVTSMSSRGKVKDEEDRSNKLRVHNVVSWKLDEYLEAVQHDELYEVVEPMLDVGSSTDVKAVKEATKNETEEERVRQKFYFAGGSCRYMFETTTAEVIYSLDEAVAGVSDIPSIFRGHLGESSPTAINRLMATFYHKGKLCWMPVSRYVSTALASKAEASTLKRMIADYGMANPVVRGCLFEMLFFEEVKTKGLSLTLRGERKEPLERWEVCLIDSFNPRSPLLNSLPEGRTCFRPEGIFQGGFDAVIVDTEARKVEFVQVTTAKKHSFKLKYFLQALRALGIPAGAGWNLRVIFVTLQTHLKQFQIEPAENSGALETYGWEAGRESQQAEVAALDITV